ncbi:MULTISPECIES: PAN domain-containing protein [unclassified Microcoleus]
MGADYRNMYISQPDPDICQQIRAFDEQCQAFTFVRPEVEDD